MEAGFSQIQSLMCLNLRVGYGHIADTFSFHWKQVSLCCVPFPIDGNWSESCGLLLETNLQLSSDETS